MDGSCCCWYVILNITRKITHNLANIKYQIENNKIITPFELGNIYCKRDWSDSEDFIKAIWIILNKSTANEYLLSSNKSHSIKDFIDKCCKIYNIDCRWDIDKINQLNTKLIYKNIPIITISEKFYRPAEIYTSVGNSSKTYKELDWEPEITFDNLVNKMCSIDYKLIKEEEENKRR